MEEEKTPDQEFAALLALARQGNEDAVARLVEFYEPEVRRVAHQRLGTALRSHLDSMDLVQSVHRSLLIGLRRNKFDISSPEKLIGLAVEMVRRKISRHARTVNREQERLRRLVELVRSRHRDQAKEAVDAQLNDLVRAIWSQLSEDECRLLELRLEGHSTVAAARLMNRTPEYLRVRLFRVRRRLRAIGLGPEDLV